MTLGRVSPWKLGLLTRSSIYYSELLRDSDITFNIVCTRITVSISNKDKLFIKDVYSATYSYSLVTIYSGVIFMKGWYITGLSSFYVLNH